MPNERQAELFDALKAHGMTIGHLTQAKYLDIDERQGYRIVNGDGVFRYEHARRLLHTWPDELVNVLAHDLLRDAHRVIIHVPDEAASSDVDRAAAASLMKVAEFLEQRADDARDGIITQAERDREAALVTEGIQALHRLYHDVQRQRVAMPAKRKEEGPCLQLRNDSPAAS